MHLTPIRMATMKTKTKAKNSKHWQGCGETGTLGHCTRECKMVQLLGNFRLSACCCSFVGEATNSIHFLLPRHQRKIDSFRDSLCKTRGRNLETFLLSPVVSNFGICLLFLFVSGYFLVYHSNMFSLSG